jgi:two-component system, chemotaxis family, CheB/CheR fusion protein
LERYFHRYGENYQIQNEIRDTIVFAPQNILADPPFSKLDILSCRNFLIYVNHETQRRILPHSSTMPSIPAGC